MEKSTTDTKKITYPQSDIHSNEMDKTSHAQRLAARFNKWRTSCIPDPVFLIILAVIIGMLAGLCAFIFKHSIAYLSEIFVPEIKDGQINWWLPLLSTCGIITTGIFTRYITDTNLTHCTAQLIQSLRHKTYRLRRNIMFSPIIGGTITLGCGGSAGAEGPIAYAGAAIGSNIGQFLGMDNQMLKTLVGCGAGAGIAGIFSAPVGGLMFTLELLRINLTANSIIALTAACLSAYLTIFTCYGFQPDLVMTSYSGFDTSLLPMTICLGLFCGIYCIYYSSVTSHLDSFYKKIRNPWIRNITGGLSLGLILLLFPAMYGPGYPVISHIINEDYTAMARGCVMTLFTEDNPSSLMLIAAGIIICKCWAVSSSNSSGGVAGDFAPTLFAGCFAGYLFASSCNSIFGTQLPEGLFAYIAMAGVMAGAIEAPLMAIFITLEMTGSYHLALPISLCALISYITIRLSRHMSGNHHRMITHHIWFAKEKSATPDTDK